jgi:hypothetical protein
VREGVGAGDELHAAAMIVAIAQSATTFGLLMAVD